ncbi:MAG: polysaccharide deacetylase family protein [Nitrospinales bacterium]
MRAILTFHSIDKSNSILSYSSGMFEQLLNALAKSDLPICDLDSLLSSDNQRGVALTFDDGMRSVLTSALPILKDHGAPAHLFLTSGFISSKESDSRQPEQPSKFEMLNWREVESLHSEGIIIESHTANHPDLRKLTKQELEQECLSADDIIEKRIGRRPKYFAYPFGYYNASVKEFTGGIYKACMTTELSPLKNHGDKAKLPRLDSYYLRNPLLFENFESTVSKTYLSARRLLRKLKGSE